MLISVAPAALGTLLGVLIGGLISAATTFITADAGRRANIATVMWPRRVETHQTAFEMWWQLLYHICDDDRTELRAKALDAEYWWAKNSLYMSEEASIKFKQMLVLVTSHNRYEDKLATENMRDIMAVGQILADGVGRHFSDELLAKSVKGSE